MNLPSQEYLISRIDYNPETGEAKWKPVDESFGTRWKHFNSLYANKPLPAKDTQIADTRTSTARLLYKLYHGVEPETSIRFLDKNSANLRISNLTVLKQVIPIDSSFLSSNKAISTDFNELLRYDHVSGILYWKRREGNNLFNSKFEGKPAGHLTERGYVDIKIMSSKYRSHRLAWVLYYGVDPDKYLIDHIDRNKRNNSIRNLRLASNSLNQHSDSSRGWDLINGKYAVRMKINGSNKSLGRYDTEAEAEVAYKNALEKLKPTYQFTESEQTLLDQLYNTYPNCTAELQRACHDLHVKAINYYVDAAIVQTVN